MSKPSNRETTFRFPFDIDTRYFLILAVIFFILAIRPVTRYLVIKDSIPTVLSSVEREVEKQINQFEKLGTDSLSIQSTLRNEASGGPVGKMGLLSVWCFLIPRS